MDSKYSHLSFPLPPITLPQGTEEEYCTEYRTIPTRDDGVLITSKGGQTAHALHIAIADKVIAMPTDKQHGKQAFAYCHLQPLGISI